MVIFLIVILASAAAVAFFILPTAHVIVTPAQQERTAAQTIFLSTAAQEPDFQRFILPARVVEAQGEVSDTVQREGGLPAGQAGAAHAAKAQGIVRLFNTQDEEQPLLPQTHLRHDASGIFFLTDKAVRIPPQGDVEVPVTAKEEGSNGDVPAGKFVVDKLPTSLQAQVWGESKTAFSGGEVFDVPLTEGDIATAQEAVVKKARDQARGELTAAAGGAAIRDDLLAETIEEKTSSAAPGSHAAAYIVSARVRLRAFVVDDTAVLSLTLLALQALPKPNEEFVMYRPESFSVDLQRADFERGEAHVVGHLTGSFTQKTESTIFDTRALAGRTPAEVQEYFKQFSSVGSVAVTLAPWWVTTVPARAGAVEIVVQKK